MLSTHDEDANKQSISPQGKRGILSKALALLSRTPKLRSAIGKPLSVLVVDDNPVNLKLAKKAIEELSKDIKVEICSSGEEAAKKISEGNIFDITLLDNQLGPREKCWWGEETAEKIREIEKSMQIKPSFIITWSSDSDRTKEEQKYLHANSLLKKPLDKKALKNLFIDKGFLSPYQSPATSKPSSPSQSTETTPVVSNTVSQNTSEQDVQVVKQTFDYYKLMVKINELPSSNNSNSIDNSSGSSPIIINNPAVSPKQSQKNKSSNKETAISENTHVMSESNMAPLNFSENLFKKKTNTDQESSINLNAGLSPVQSPILKKKRK